MRNIALIILALALLLPLVQALPDEAAGNVTDVTDGDTFTIDSTILVRLADVNSPELTAEGGPEAKEYTRELLLGKQVFLDLDNLTGVDKYGRSVAVVYLANANGSVGDNFNRMIVDAGHAKVNDYQDNEFDPTQWWPETGTSDNLVSEKKYVGSTESDKYHYPECRWAKKILPENEIWFSSSEDARSKGYVPCGICHPL
jgi:micrococcal nuclease